MKPTQLLAMIGMITLTLAVLAAGGCANPQSSTQNDLRASATDAGLLSNTGQNAQLWPDGSQQTGSTQLDSGAISPEVTNWMGTAVSSVLAVNKNGVQVKNTGDLEADSMVIVFGDPFSEEDGTVIVPIASIEIVGLSNASTPIVEASTEQVALWVSVLSNLSADQRDVMIRALERDESISTDTLGAIKAGLELASPVP